MNGVSQDLKLAIAVHRAGAMPSLMPTNLVKDVKLFKKLSKNSDIVICICESEILSSDFIDQLIDLEIKFIEVLRDDIDVLQSDSLKPFSKHWSNKSFLKNLLRLKKSNIKILYRFTRDPIDTYDLIDAVCIKGKESAGFTGNTSIAEQMEKQKNKTPNVHLITYGGISGPNDVKKYLDLGASAVGVGTLFAASLESCLSMATKKLMISKSKKDIKVFEDTKQNALIINFEDVEKDKKFNRVDSLELGIKGQGGHIYAGHSIDGVKEILKVSQIVENLVSFIK